MIRKIWLTAFMLCVFIASGCSKDQSVKSDLGKSKTEIILRPGEFRVVKTIQGEASSSYLFWLDFSPILRSFSQSPVPVIAFQLGSPNLHERAMRDLYSQHDLQGKPQILHNFLEEYTLANYLGLYAVIKLSISAEVIEFTGNENYAY